MFYHAAAIGHDITETHFLVQKGRDRRFVRGTENRAGGSTRSSGFEAVVNRVDAVVVGRLEFELKRPRPIQLFRR
jgi:hypothetical protein